MGMTNKEKNQAYRARMYAAGFKQMRIWVPRESEGKSAKADRKMFMAQIEALTAGWNERKLSGLFSQTLMFINAKIKEEQQQKSGT